MTILGLESIKNNNSLYIYNKNLKNNYSATYDNKQMVLTDGLHSAAENYEHPTWIEFFPLNEKKKSCSYLLINDSIHLYLRNLAYSLFRKIITAKDGTIVYRESFLTTSEFYMLPNPTKNTIYKFNNLFNIISATSFSKNLISFSIDFTNSPENAKVDFKYPLYDALCTIQNNTIFGIHLEDFEVELFKQIYQNYIINTVDNLFKEDIEISKNSRNYPCSYALMTVRVKLEETFWKEYNISYIWSIKTKLLGYYEMLANLNQLTNMIPSISKQQQDLDLQSYRNELEIRKASEPNWLIFKDGKMQENLNIQQIEVIADKNKDILIETLEKRLETVEKRYFKQIDNFLVNELANDFIQNYQLMKNNQEYSEIFSWQKLVLDILKGNGASLWFDTRIDKYCFRSKIGGDIVYEKKEKISELLTRALKESITTFLNSRNSGFLSTYAIEIVLVYKLKGIDSQQLNTKEKASNVIKILLFENAILTIDDDRFDIQSYFEFIKNHDALLYTRNRFIPTKYLVKRFHNSFLPNNNTINYNNLFNLSKDAYLLEKVALASEQTVNFKRSSFIEGFIFCLVDEDIHVYYYMMNWLACFFNSLQKSGTALVLLGNQEVTQEIFWDKIIKEIFGLQYCITINDKECSTATSFDIAKDKLFFHVGDITNPVTKFDDATMYKLVKDFLIQPSVARVNENDEQEEVTIYGQTIITAKNPSPYIKKAMSKCTIIKVSDIDTIIEKLGVPDELMLEDRIQKDLDNFANVLRSFNRNHEFAKHAMDTEDRKSISNDKSPNIDKEDIENKIDAFIQAIKNKDINYFEKLRDIEDDAIYEHLKNAFNKDEGYFIGQDLLYYYNATHEQKFANKKQLMDKLKEKDEMFAQEVKTLKILTPEQKEEILFQPPKSTKEINYKELYKINGYIMAKDIIIPYGAIIITSQDNIRKYNHPNVENAIKLNEEYKEKKAKEKN
ncbi:MAG: hypothetical protein NTW78_05635 [Campylobacterales bacterium]|nr:hypothetical protein [Campylobacterales bacterium]